MSRITERQWVEYFGFQRFPFDRPEAGNEEFARPDFLATCFVEPRSFEAVLGHADGPVSALLFAERGSGKTACRVMLDYYCQHGQANPGRRYVAEKPDYALCIPHTHLDEVLTMAGLSTPAGEPMVRVEHHVVVMLRQALPALASLLSKAPALREEVKRLPAAERRDLQQLIAVYGQALLSVQSEFLLDLCSEAPQGLAPSAAPAVSPLAHLARLAGVLRRAGIAATYALVDGIDEMPETAGDPVAAVALIRPLLASLRLVDGTPFFRLKVFLPDHLKSRLLADEAIRRDRLPVIESLRWRTEDLISILRRRLEAQKRADDRNQDRTEMSFDALCVPELRGAIETDLVRLSKHNPRRLLLICGFMVSFHCVGEAPDQDDPYQLNPTDLQAAVQELERRLGTPPALIAATSELDVRELIRRGEDAHVEFKASLRWDYRSGMVNKSLPMVIGKTITGMLNGAGGVLLIGVADDGTVLGLDQDLATLTKPTQDGFQLALVDAVKTYLGLEHMQYVQIRFEMIEGRTVCVVLVSKSREPVYFQANEAHEFWVRIGNSTRSLDVKAALNYIRAHWEPGH